jgi:hypothetical protein
MQIDTSGWSGEGGFTAVVLDALKTIDAIEHLRVEDAPASRADSGYAFISNEIYVRFRTEPRAAARGRLGLPGFTRTDVKDMSLHELAARLGMADAVGAPDYADDGLLQYLRTERVVAPYQTRGFKVIEMVRIYEAGTTTGPQASP